MRVLRSARLQPVPGLFQAGGGERQEAVEAGGVRPALGHAGLRPGELRHDGQILTPIATSADKALVPTSVYALSKYDQECLCLMVGGACQHPPGAAFRNYRGEQLGN